MPRFVLHDLTGQIFGRLLVLYRDMNYRKGRARWICRCSCGREISVIGASLLTGNTKSCGCLQRTHGLRKHPIYKAWCNIKTRCYNSKSKDYVNYGARGIKLNPIWEHDFQSFFDCVLSLGWEEGLTLDRIDFNGNYDYGNLRWVPKAEQARNTRKNVMIDGVCASEKARQLGLPESSIARRLKWGWSLEDAINRPLRKGDFRRKDKR